MDFQLVHQVDIPRAAYFDVVLSPDFVAWVKQKMQQDEREVVRQEEVGGVLYRTVRSERVLSPKAQKHFKVPRFVMEEHLEIERERGFYRWRYVPNVGANRFTSHGTGEVEPHGDGVRLTIRGTVGFRIPLIGKRIERHTVGWLENNFHQVLAGLEDFYRSGYRAGG
jgi:hypothetical protein